MDKIKEEFPDIIYTEERIGSNGIDCLDYRNFDTDIEYIKKSVRDKEIEELQSIIKDYRKQLSYVNDDIVILKSEIKKLRNALEATKIQCNNYGKRLVLYGDNDIIFFAKNIKGGKQMDRYIIDWVYCKKNEAGEWIRYSEAESIIKKKDAEIRKLNTLINLKQALLNKNKIYFQDLLEKDKEIKKLRDALKRIRPWISTITDGILSDWQGDLCCDIDLICGEALEETE